MTDFNALADRVQALTSACRETDLAIMQAISGHPWRWADSRTFEPQTVITWDQYGEGAPGNPFYTLEEFTASLDAAMTLAVKAFTIRIEAGTQKHAADFEWPVVTIWRQSDGRKICKVQTITLPITLSAAWLRARAALENSHG